MWYGFSHANGRTTLQAPKYDIVLPRLGFSWQMRNNTVVRGGFGMYASTWSEDTYGGGMGNAFGSNGGYNDYDQWPVPGGAIERHWRNSRYYGPGLRDRLL